MRCPNKDSNTNLCVCVWPYIMLRLTFHRQLVFVCSCLDAADARRDYAQSVVDAVYKNAACHCFHGPFCLQYRPHWRCGLHLTSPYPFPLSFLWAAHPPIVTLWFGRHTQVQWMHKVPRSGGSWSVCMCLLSIIIWLKIMSRGGLISWWFDIKIINNTDLLVLAYKTISRSSEGSLSCVPASP